jgi:hypothetical protein
MMAQHWASKAPNETVERYWVVPLQEGDSVDTFTASFSGATLVESEHTDDGIRFVISGGTLDETAVASLTATTSRDLILAETFYLSIQPSDNAFSQTVAEVVSFALRPVIGIGEVATADEQADALEVLGDMIAEWDEGGANVGMRLPPLASDVIYALDSHISAIKANLRVRLCEFYTVPVRPTDALAAARGMQRVKMSQLPKEPVGEDFF